MPVERYIYWDSCVFAAYISQEPGRVEIIETLWGEIAGTDADRIVTATLSIAEVAYVGTEKLRRILEPQTTANIDAMWHDPSVLMVEVSAPVMYIARDLMRAAIPHGWSLRPNDVIHLATALWVHKNVHPISHFHTYDQRLHKYTALIGLPIGEPQIKQSLPLTLSDEA